LFKGAVELFPSGAGAWFQWKYGGAGLSAEPITLQGFSHREETCEADGQKALEKGFLAKRGQDKSFHRKLKGPHAFCWKFP
jgi:hypothetical protein